MSQDHVPPQLTSEGEQLLADVLRRRAESPIAAPRRSTNGHDTATARSNRARRERDALRVPPIDLEQPAHEPEAKSRVLLVSGMLVGAVVLAVLALSAFSPSATVATEVAGAVEERPERTTESAQAVESTDVATTADAEVARSVPDIDGSLPVEGIDAPLAPTVDPKSIEVSVYDEDPAINGVHSFALRVKSISTEAEIDTDAFVVVVVDEAGVESQTFSRFIHSTLPVESSALATVRSEGSSPQQQYVVVRIGTTEIARIPIGL